MGNVYIFSPLGSTWDTICLRYHRVLFMSFAIQNPRNKLYSLFLVERWNFKRKKGRFKTTKYGLFNISGWIVFIIIEILCKNWLSRDLRQIITQTVRQKASDILLFCEDNADNFPVWIYVIRYLVIDGTVLLFFKHLIKFLLFCHYPMRKRKRILIQRVK